MARTKKENPIDFETSLSQLNSIVDNLENGGLSLEDALKNFENGIALVRQCQEALKSAEQRIQILTEQNGKSILASYEDED